MECAICFNVVQKLKILTCGHYFCEQCMKDLSHGKVVKHQQSALKEEILAKMAVQSGGSTATPSAPRENATSIKSVSSSNENKDSKESAVTLQEIECPQCRQKTILDARGLTALRTKFVGVLNCYQCDDNKMVTEFRWCEDCNLSVCSSCYVDKHTSTSADGYVRLHTASKWEEYKPVEFCISQLKGKASRVHSKAENAKEYLAGYLESLQEYLGQDLDRRTRNLTSDVQEKGRKLAESFGMNYDEIDPAFEDVATFSYLLPDLEKLVGYEKGFLKSTANDADFQIRSIPFKEMAKHMLSADKRGTNFEPTWFDPLLLQKNAKETMVIGANLLKYPNDICMVDTSTVLITDKNSGIFIFKDNCMLKGPIPLKHSYSTFGNVAKLPNELKRSLAMVSVKAHDKPWSFIVIDCDGKKKEAEQVSYGKTAHWVLPTKEPMSLASSNYTLFGRSTKNLWKFLSPEADNQWVMVYSFFQECLESDCMGPVIERAQNADVYLVNSQWKCVDIVSVGRQHTLWGVRRIEFPQATSFKTRFPMPQSSSASVAPAAVQTSGDLVLINLDDNAETMCAFDRGTGRILVWNRNSVQDEMNEIYRFRSKVPRKVILSDTCVHMIAAPKENLDGIRSLEIINL